MRNNKTIKVVLVSLGITTFGILIMQSFTNKKIAYEDLEYSRSNYQKSIPMEPSLEDVIVQNYDKLGLIKDYYSGSKINKEFIIKETNDIKEKILRKSLQQYNEMMLKNMNVEYIRLSSKDINSYYNDEFVKNQMSSNDELIEKYKLSDEDYMSIETILYNSKNDFPDNLRKVVINLEKYFSIGKKIKYTYLEYFLDATGHENPYLFMSNITREDRTIGVRMGSKYLGLSTRSALKRIESLTANPSATITVKTFPNPIVDEVYFRFLAEKSGNVNILISDIKGTIVINHNSFTERGAYECKLDVSNLKRGLYVYVVNVNGKKTSGKLIKNN